MNLVAWETHFSLAGDGDLQLVMQSLIEESRGGLPVRERGHSRYALQGLVRLEGETLGPDANYYTVQNRFNEETGRLDYAVTLLGPGNSRPLASSSPGSGQDRWLIGRIVFSGQSPGSIQVSPNTESDPPFQAVSLSEAGERLPIPLSAGSPLATVRVASSDTILSLEGQIAGISSTGSSSMELVVTFRNPEAVPPWLQGLDKPVAIYRELVSDGNGRFRIADISPTILEALGLPATEGVFGRSLWGVLTRGEVVPERELIAEGVLYGPEQKALVRWPQKATLNVVSRERRLYDLSTDPTEQRNLAGTQPAVVNSMLSDLVDRVREATRARVQRHAAAIPAETREKLRALGYLD